MTDVQWESLRPILQDMADRIARMEQFLASSGLQVAGQAGASAGNVFDAVPSSFGSPPSATPAPVVTPAQIAAANHGVNIGGDLNPEHQQVPDYIVQMARSGKLMNAIKEYRAMTGWALAEAKAAVEFAAGVGRSRDDL